MVKLNTQFATIATLRAPRTQQGGMPLSSRYDLAVVLELLRNCDTFQVDEKLWYLASRVKFWDCEIEQIAEDVWHCFAAYGRRNTHSPSHVVRTPDGLYCTCYVRALHGRVCAHVLAVQRIVNPNTRRNVLGVDR